MSDFTNMLHDPFTELPFKLMFLTIVFLFGICIGSFLNVVIIRLPLGESLIKRSSHCMKCGTKIRPVDLVPVFSWLMLGGKCHSCGDKISPRYPIVESLNGILYVLTFIVLDINAKAIITCLLMSLLICVGFMDWDTMEIDERILVFILLLAIPAAIFTDDVSLLHRFIGAAAVSLPFYIIGEVSRPIIRRKYEADEDFRNNVYGEADEDEEEAGGMRAIAIGDTELMFAAGALLGTQAIIVSAFVGILAAAVGGLVSKFITKQSKFAFGPYLSIGIAVAMLWGKDLAAWYINLLFAEPMA